jgi:hypothetical protein
MENQNAMAPLSRRKTLLGAALGAIGSSAVAKTASAAGAGAHPDAELIRLCAEFDALEHHINSHYAGGAPTKCPTNGATRSSSRSRTRNTTC